MRNGDCLGEQSLDIEINTKFVLNNVAPPWFIWLCSPKPVFDLQEMR